MKRVYLSPPHLDGGERELLEEVFRSNWIAPLGPQVDAFEAEFALFLQVPHALALSSGTAAIHLALILAGVRPGDEVVVSTLTFAASAFPVRYVGARPVFIDCERLSWNMDPDLLAGFLDARAAAGKLPAAVVAVHLYGQSANLDAIGRACRRHGIPLIEDAAEALGASFEHRFVGTFGQTGVFSFNGNKIITTSGGGMLVSSDAKLITQARKLASQSRDLAPHYEHSEVGYNYRMSNLLAAVGRAQLRCLEERVLQRRAVFERYQRELSELPGVAFMPEAPWGRSTRWLTVITLDPELSGLEPEELRLALEAHNIESRPVWKPMHLQPVFRECEAVGGGVAEELFARGLCLPSGSNLLPCDQDRVIDIIRQTINARRGASAWL